MHILERIIILVFGISIQFCHTKNADPTCNISMEKAQRHLEHLLSMTSECKIKIHSQESKSNSAVTTLTSNMYSCENFAEMQQLSTEIARYFNKCSKSSNDNEKMRLRPLIDPFQIPYNCDIAISESELQLNEKLKTYLGAQSDRHHFKVSSPLGDTLQLNVKIAILYKDISHKKIKLLTKLNHRSSKQSDFASLSLYSTEIEFLDHQTIYTVASRLLKNEVMPNLSGEILPREENLHLIFYQDGLESEAIFVLFVNNANMVEPVFEYKWISWKYAGNDMGFSWDTATLDDQFKYLEKEYSDAEYLQDLSKISSKVECSFQ